MSGGEEGALLGPAIMPGGPPEAWDALAPIFRAIAAKADDGEPCVEYMGPRGAGHYVKMVHNGIEYGDMQLIAETYDLLHRGAGLSAPRARRASSRNGTTASCARIWSRSPAKIFERIDEETGQPLVDVILDEAQQKGTGKWMSQNAFDIGAPIPTVNAAVEARILSSLKSRTRRRQPRAARAGRLTAAAIARRLVDAARQALYASKITSYAQGMAHAAPRLEGIRLRHRSRARSRRSGGPAASSARACSSDIRRAFDARSRPRQPAARRRVPRRDRASARTAWRHVVQTAIGLGIPVPAMGASLAYYDSYRSERLPANLTQAQRDFFGAHTYRRVDRDGVFHTDWTGDARSQPWGATHTDDQRSTRHSRRRRARFPRARRAHSPARSGRRSRSARRRPARFTSAAASSTPPPTWPTASVCAPASPRRWSSIRSAS